LEILKAAEERLRGKIRIESVVPDYYAKYPKPCMGGWGRKLMLITPKREALPCHAAKIIPNLQFDNVMQRSLGEIWESSAAFQKFRGEDWMQDPCKTCDRRSIDFGGCRLPSPDASWRSYGHRSCRSLSTNRTKVDAILANVNAATKGAANDKGAALISHCRNRRHASHAPRLALPSEST